MTESKKLKIGVSKLKKLSFVVNISMQTILPVWLLRIVYKIYCKTSKKVIFNNIFRTFGREPRLVRLHLKLPN